MRQLFEKFKNIIPDTPTTGVRQEKMHIDMPVVCTCPSYRDHSLYLYFVKCHHWLAILTGLLRRLSSYILSWTNLQTWIAAKMS